MNNTKPADDLIEQARNFIDASTGVFSPFNPEGVPVSQLMADFAKRREVKVIDEFVGEVQDVMGDWGGPERKVVDGMMAELFKRAEEMKRE